MADVIRTVENKVVDETKDQRAGQSHDDDETAEPFGAPRQGEADDRRDFFPLVVDYREKTYAAGKFPGGFIKREGRPTTKEILTSRLIDRPIRPLFPAGYFREVQVMSAVLSINNLAFQ